jgi:hypothetical protein
MAQLFVLFVLSDLKGNHPLGDVENMAIVPMKN